MLLCQTHDEAWSVQLSQASDIPELRARFDFLKNAVHRGDHRVAIGARSIESVAALIEAMPSKLMVTPALRNLLQQSVRETESLLRRIRVKSPDAQDWSVTLG